MTKPINELLIQADAWNTLNIQCGTATSVSAQLPRDLAYHLRRAEQNTIEVAKTVFGITAHFNAHILRTFQNGLESRFMTAVICVATEIERRADWHIHNWRRTVKVAATLIEREYETYRYNEDAWNYTRLAQHALSDS